MKIGIIGQGYVGTAIKLGFQDHYDILTYDKFDLAKSTQTMYEEVFYNLLNATHSQYGIDNLSLAGGCAMNSLANGGIFRNTPYKKVYIH